MLKQFYWLAIIAAFVFCGCGSISYIDLKNQLHEEPFELTNAVVYKNKKSDIPNFSLPDFPLLKDYITYSLLNNNKLRASYYKWMAAIEKIPQASSLPDPKISFTNYIREVETRVGPQKNRYTIMQKIPWPGKILSRTDIAYRNALVEKYMYDAQKLTVLYSVKKAYYEYYYLQQSIEVVKDSLIILEDLEEVVRKGYETSSSSNSALIKLQIEMGKVEEKLESLKSLRGALASRLNSAIGKNDDLLLPWPDNVPDNIPALEEKTLLAVLKDDNPGLKAAREKINMEQSKKRFARAQGFPDFSFGGSFIETDKRSDMMLDENGKDPVMVTVEMTLPLWWRKNLALRRQAQAGLKAAENMLIDKENNLSTSLKLAFFRYADAIRKYNLFDKTLLPKAEQALDTSRKSFETGGVAFADLQESERTLLELRLMAVRSKVDSIINLAEIEMLSGREFVSYEQQTAKSN
jgi:outer membrane protein TolC